MYGLLWQSKQFYPIIKRQVGHRASGHVVVPDAVLIGLLAGDEDNLVVLRGLQRRDEVNTERLIQLLSVNSNCSWSKSAQNMGFRYVATVCQNWCRWRPDQAERTPRLRRVVCT